MLIHIIDDDQIFASVLKRYLKGYEVRTFSNAIDAINALEKKIPDLIFLDILLDGPDRFTYLDEIASYSDTNSIPTVLISSLYHELPKLKDYNVIAYLDKTKFTPDDIKEIIDGRH